MRDPSGPAIIDTSAIIHLREERYAQDVFPALNLEIEQAARDQRVITVDRVIDELDTQSAGKSESARVRRLTADWVKETLHLPDESRLLSELVEINRLAVEIADEHQSWRNVESADPLVIATAEVIGGTVVSGELPRIDNPRNPKPTSGSGRIRNQYGLYSSWIRIPDICLIRGIPHLDLLSLFRSQRWSF